MKNIIFTDNIFLLNTKNTSYLFKVDKFLHLEHIYYGSSIRISDADALCSKSICRLGDLINYDKNDDNYCLDIINQEISTSGRGDYREPSILIENKNVLDFKYVKHEIIDGDTILKTLPNSYNADETLIITLKDEIENIKLELYYSIYYESDVITRRIVLYNESNEKIKINKIMSMSLDMTNDNLQLLTFNGSWINEANLITKDIEVGTYINQSLTGFSSNKSNPGFIIKSKETTQDFGEAWGFNLIYSGSHYTSVSKNTLNNIRIMSGINPERFSYDVDINEFFETPVLCMTYTDKGLNELSYHFHEYINENIIRGPYKKKKRPILINSWEAYMFKFNKNNLLSLAKQAKDLGIELFVLDDGWFINRNDDKTGLGNYEVDKKKIPGGIKSLSKKIHNMKMKFGIWVEPEAISIDTALYQKHPDWAIENNHHTIYGRNELLMDLTNDDVKNYIVDNVIKLIEDNNIDYIKWDMNRQLSGISGKYNHDYIISLYEILNRIFKDRNILFESCSSGGNRFDLGMLCFSPQIWASDNTDGIERVRIQNNLSYLYPLSTMGSHVAASVSSQALRKVPLDTRFNISCFGDLGYELDLTMLSSLEKKEIKKQISYYKKHRELFQYGRLYRLKDEENRISLQVKKDYSIVGKFRYQQHSAPGFDKLYCKDLIKDKNYNIVSRQSKINIEAFGQLINHLLPIKVNSDSLTIKQISKYYGLEIKSHKYKASGSALEKGIILNNLYSGTGYNEYVRIPLDFGSELYLIKGEENND